MNGLIMDYELNVPAILRRGEQLFPDKEIVTRRPDKSFHRYTYADFAGRTKQLALALRGLGLEDGDRVAHLLLEPLPAPGGLHRRPGRPASSCTR